MPHFARVTPTNLNPTSVSAGGTGEAPTNPVIVADEEGNKLSLARDGEDEADVLGRSGLSKTKSRGSFSLANASARKGSSAGRHTGLLPKDPPPLRCQGVFSVNVEDKAAVSTIARELIPLISARDNVTVLLSGHEKTGKTCLLEQLLIQIVDGIKIALTSAEEAHQENMSIGLETEAGADDGGNQTSGTMRRAQTPGGDRLTQQADAALGGITGGNNAAGSGSPAIRNKRAQTAGSRRPGSSKTRPGSSQSPQRLNSAGGWRAGSPQGRLGSPPRPSTASGYAGGGGDLRHSFDAAGDQPHEKYALLFSRLGPNANSLSMSEVRSMRPQSAKHPLLPKMEPPVAGSIGNQLGMSGLTGGSPGGRGGAAASPDQDGAAKKVDINLMKQQHLRSKSPLRMFQGLSTHIKNNGRCGGDHSTLRFDGTKSTYYMPHIPEVDLALKSPEGLKITFWICTDDEAAAQRKKMGLFHFTDELDPNFTVRMILNCNDNEMFEFGQSLITLRDSHGRTVEMQFSDGICDGKWHRVAVEIQASQNIIELTVDGKKCRFKIQRAESPAAIYEERPKIGRVGCIVAPSIQDGKMGNAYHFQGYMCDWMYLDGKTGNQIAHFPLLNTLDGKELAEKKSRYPMMTVGGGADGSQQQSEATQEADIDFLPQFENFAFPATAPYFDGKSTFVHVGNLGDFGTHINAFSMEFNLRTGCTTSPMTVIGVTDHSGKATTRRPGFSVDLNMSSTGTTQRYSLCLTVADYSGHFLCATSQDCNELFDDRWHHMSIKLVDAALGRFKVKLDGKPIDLVNHHSSPLPSDFASFSQFVTIGCQNSRGRMINHFKGSIYGLSLSRTCDDLDELVGSWAMEEGPGAVLAMDSTGHGYNGVYSVAKGVQGSVWYPREGLDTNAAAAGQDDGFAAALANVEVRNVRHSNNVCTMAFLGLQPRVAVNGNVSDQLIDFINGSTFDALVPKDLKATSKRAPKCDERKFKWIPSQCFKVVTPGNYQRVFGTALAKSQDFGNRAHLIFVLRLGDAIFSVFDLASYSKSRKALFNSTQHTWTDSISTFGVSNKLNRALNHDLGLLDKFLLRCGSHPQMYKRSSMLLHNTVSLQSDSFLVSLVMFSMLSGKEVSRLFNVMLFTPYSIRMEGVHLMSIAHAMNKADRDHAAVVVQKIIRFRRDRRLYFDKLKNFDEAAARRDHAALQRRDYPAETKTKAAKQALLFFCLDFEKDPKLSSVPFGFDDMAHAGKLLDGLGYKVASFVNPTADMIRMAIAREQEKADKQQLLVYFVGYGLQDTPYAVPPSFETIRKWYEKMQDDERLAILKSEHKKITTLKDVFEGEKQELLEEAKRKEAELAAKSNKKGKKGGAKTTTTAAPAPAKKKPEPKAKPGSKKGKAAAAVAAAQEAEAAAAAEGAEAEARKAKDIADAEAAAAAALAQEMADKEAEDQRPIIEPIFDREPKSFFFTGESTSMYNAENTILMSELRTLVVGNTPRRGIHAIFLYDCVAPKIGDVASSETSITSSSTDVILGSSWNSPDLENSSSTLRPRSAAPSSPHSRPLSPTSRPAFPSASRPFLRADGGGHQKSNRKATLQRDDKTAQYASGFGGFVGSSSEEIHILYQPTQRFLLGFYLKRLFLGCGVESIRIGKNEPPAETTLETAFTYLSKKLNPRNHITNVVANASGPPKFPVLQYHCKMYGDYIGDSFLCEKVVQSRSDRKKLKVTTSGKKHHTKIACRHVGPWTPDLRPAVLQRLTAVSRCAMLDSRRLHISPTFTLALEGDWHVAMYHPKAKAEISAMLDKWFPTWDNSPHVSSVESQRLKDLAYTGKAGGVAPQPTWLLTINPLSLKVTPAINAPCFANPMKLEDDRGQYDVKAKSREFTAMYESQHDLTERLVVEPVKALNRELERFNWQHKIQVAKEVKVERERIANDTRDTKPSFVDTSAFEMTVEQEDNARTPITVRPHFLSASHVGLPMPTTSGSSSSLLKIRYTEITMTVTAMNNEDGALKLERGARSGQVHVTHAVSTDINEYEADDEEAHFYSGENLTPCVTTLMSARVYTDKEGQRFVAEEQMFTHEEQRKVAEAKAQVFREAEERKKRDDKLAKLELAKESQGETIESVRVASVVTDSMISDCFKLPHIDCYVAAMDTMLSLANRGLGVALEKGEVLSLVGSTILNNDELISQYFVAGALSDPTVKPTMGPGSTKTAEKLMSLVWKLFTALGSEKSAEHGKKMRKAVQYWIPVALNRSLEYFVKASLLWVNIRGTLQAVFPLPSSYRNALAAYTAAIASGKADKWGVATDLPPLTLDALPGFVTPWAIPQVGSAKDLVGQLLLDEAFAATAANSLSEENLLALVENCYSTSTLMRIALAAGTGKGSVPKPLERICLDRAIAIYNTFSPLLLETQNEANGITVSADASHFLAAATEVSLGDLRCCATLWLRETKKENSPLEDLLWLLMLNHFTKKCNVFWLHDPITGRPKDVAKMVKDITEGFGHDILREIITTKLKPVPARRLKEAINSCLEVMQQGGAAAADGGAPEPLSPEIVQAVKGAIKILEEERT